MRTILAAPFGVKNGEFSGAWPTLDRYGFEWAGKAPFSPGPSTISEVRDEEIM